MVARALTQDREGLRRTPERVFVFIVEGVMIGAGVSLLVQS